ncbi:N-acetyltransferase [Streptococcus ruminantium]|uniref:N-acetyltransferase n=2 Tax=Streptococcus ruminantium TaxID=1917441 RepID=A0A2Z5TTT2_9STRE|nr:N-acetyltransferase [Streptococcus ruminantium]
MLQWYGIGIGGKIMTQEVTIAPLIEAQLYQIWQIGYSQSQPEWKKWDGPYFEDYQMYPDFEAFRMSRMYDFHLAHNVWGIFIDQQPIGIVTQHWEDEKTRWLEIGIVIYDEQYWNGGYGTKALDMWVGQIFKTTINLEHIGLTTWSGNHRMMRAAEKIGMVKEAQIRKVRYWQGHYWDSVKYGILREEWTLQIEKRQQKS